MRSKLILLTVLMLSMVLVSCQNPGVRDDGASVEPTDRTIYDFDSYEELLASFSADDPDSIIQLEKGKWGVYYLAFVYEMSSRNIDVLKPYFDGEPMRLREREGFSNISLLTKEFVGLPWIWYHGIYNGRDITVKITYPLTDIPQTYSASQALYAIYPDAVNTHNFNSLCKSQSLQWFLEIRSHYKNVYETKISLKDVDTTALVYEYNDSTEKTVSIYYEGFYIMINAEAEMLNDTFWSSLSFQ